mgnify:FL=1
MDKTDTPIDVPSEPPVLEREITNKYTPTPANTPKKRKSNKWVSHVKNVAREKGISYKQALSIAKSSYVR